jgi:nucleotide-binding universal stress UspA family protein
MNLKKIVIAIDMDPNSIETLAQIKDMNFPESAEIHLVHVFEFVPNFIDLSFVFSPSEKEMAEIQLVMLEKLADVKKQLGLEMKSKIHLRCLLSSNGKQEFLQYADSIAAELVIAAAKEREGFIGLFEGSFTNFLSKYCRSNLLILRPIFKHSVV